MNWRRAIVERLGGEWDDWHGEEYGEEWDDGDSWSFSFRLHDLFRRRNAVISNVTTAKVVDIDPIIADLDVNTSQFTTILDAIAKAHPIMSKKMKITWLEDDFMPRLNAPILNFDWPEAPRFS